MSVLAKARDHVGFGRAVKELDDLPLPAQSVPELLAHGSEVLLAESVQVGIGGVLLVGEVL
jgi:hypothetical protein